MEEDLQRVLTVGEECISEAELKKLILAKGRGVDDDGEGCLMFEAHVGFLTRFQMFSYAWLFTLIR
jgi:hypothetical protein